jgi:hypothetical protein
LRRVSVYQFGARCAFVLQIGGDHLFPDLCVSDPFHTLFRVRVVILQGHLLLGSHGCQLACDFAYTLVPRVQFLKRGAGAFLSSWQLG